MRVHHVGYLVKRIERAEEIFSTLGYGRVTQTVLDPIRNVDISFWEKDGYVIELVCPKSEDSVVAGLIKKYKNTPYHICYESDDLESDMELLKRVGGVRRDGRADPGTRDSGGRKGEVFVFVPDRDRGTYDSGVTPGIGA